MSQESVQWSRAWGRKVSISFSLQLLISWLAPSRRLDLTNGLPGDHSALRFSSVAGIGRSLWIDFGLVDKKTTTRNQNPFSLCENNPTTHQKIEPGAGSVVESVGQDFWYFLFTAALDILAGS